MNKFFKIAIATGLIGICMLLILIFSQSAYSRTMKIFGVIALLLVLLSIVFFLVAFILDFKKDVKRKNYIGALLTVTLFLIIFYPLTMTFLRKR